MRQWLFKRKIVKYLRQLKGGKASYQGWYARELLHGFLLAEGIEFGDKRFKWDDKLAEKIVEEDRQFWDDLSDPCALPGDKLCV